MLRNLMVVLVSIGVGLLLGELLLRWVGDPPVRPEGEQSSGCGSGL